MNFNLIDVVIGMFIMIEIIQGISRGFTSSILGIISIVIGIYFAQKYSITVSNWLIKNTPIYKTVNGAIAGSMSGNTKTMDYLMQVLNFKKPDLTLMLINMGSFLLIYACIMVIINFIRVLLIPSIKRSSLSSLDKLGGAVFGGAKAYLLISIVYALLLPMISVMPDSSQFSKAFFSSFFTNIFLRNNFIMKYSKDIHL